jgi:hypothetical protein
VSLLLVIFSEEIVKEQNGIQIFESGEKTPGVSAELGGVDLTHFHLPYGIKIIEVNGKQKLVAGTLADFQQSEGQRLGVPPETIKTDGYPICNQVGTTNCRGAGCSAGLVCKALYNPVYKYWYCQCA